MYVKTNWENLPSTNTPLNSTNLNKIENGIYSLNEESWNTATISNSFELYTSNNPIQYRKIGKIIEIRGVVTPKNTLTASSETTIFTLPSGYRPSKQLYNLCQGSGKNSWLLTIGADGVCTCSRYGTTTNSDINNGNWLPFHFAFSID